MQPNSSLPYSMDDMISTRHNQPYICIIAVFMLLACLLPTQLSAQASRKAAGIEAGFNTVNHSGYADFTFQLSVAKHMRLAPALGYCFNHNGKSAFMVDVNIQSPFRITNGIAAYPLAGLGITNWNIRGGGSHLKVGLNLGAGMDFFMTHDIKFFLTAKYSLTQHYSGLYAGIGIAYLF